MNKWVASKTLNLIPSLFDDVSDFNFVLVNALGIDMEWAHKFSEPIDVAVLYRHEKGNDDESIGFVASSEVSKYEFGTNKEEASGLKFEATYNKYDIVHNLGEEKIKNTVKEEYVKWAKTLDKDVGEGKDLFNGDLSDQNINKVFEDFFKGYVEELKKNYGVEGKTTDFEFYVDDNVKCFVKDLKECGSNTLQYIGIMPTNEDLDKYVEKITAADISGMLNNLVSLDKGNFKEGYLTKIEGTIPKFKFDYELKLKDDLKLMGINNVFELGKANLNNMADASDTFISEAKHKANIEFTQDGIKAAATGIGGLGAGGSFDYLFKIPVIRIDLTFNKPYMFLIRDKASSEVWFVGTVYNPLSYADDTQKQF